MNKICPRFFEMKEVLGSRRTGTPFVVNSNQPFNSVDINEGHSSDDGHNDDSDSTNYYTTDEDPLCETVEVVETVDINPDESTQSREETRSWNSSANASNSNKKRRLNRVDEMINAEAKRSNEDFMKRIESLYAKALENEKILKEKAIENEKKMGFAKLEVDALMKSQDAEWMSEAEREKKIKEIRNRIFNDNN